MSTDRILWGRAVEFNLNFLEARKRDCDVAFGRYTV
jgi:hypothetical protein